METLLLIGAVALVVYAFVRGGGDKPLSPEDQAAVRRITNPHHEEASRTVIVIRHEPGCEHNPRARR